MKLYKFECVDEDQVVSLTFRTENETWQEPMARFLEFLKGNGYVFRMNDEIGIMSKGEFTSASEY